MPDYREFLRALARRPGRPTLFEPYPARSIAQTLIWRSGSNLWDTPAHRTATLISLYEYMHADTVIVEADGSDIEEILACECLLPDGMRFTVIGLDAAALAAADRSDAVCAVASPVLLSGRDFAKPLIFMAYNAIANNAKASNASCVKAAIACHNAGIHVPAHAERLWREHGADIAILGGFGMDRINEARPLAIHRAVRELYALTGGAGYALGSGHIGDGAVDYLGFISLLGMYNTLCEESKGV